MMPESVIILLSRGWVSSINPGSFAFPRHQERSVLIYPPIGTYSLYCTLENVQLLNDLRGHFHLAGIEHPRICVLAHDCEDINCTFFLLLFWFTFSCLTNLFSLKKNLGVVNCKNGVNAPLLSESMPFKIIIFFLLRDGRMESILLSFEPELALGHALANRMLWKWQLASFKSGPEEAFHLLLWEPCQPPCDQAQILSLLDESHMVHHLALMSEPAWPAAQTRRTSQLNLA